MANRSREANGNATVAVKRIREKLQVPSEKMIIVVPTQVRVMSFYSECYILSKANRSREASGNAIVATQVWMVSSELTQFEKNI